MSPLQFRSADAQHIELLRGLRPQDVDLVLKSARQRRCSARTVMTHQGERICDIRALLQGRARYFYETPTGKKLILNWITPGQTFAGLAALSAAPHIYPASTEAVRETTLNVYTHTVSDSQRNAVERVAGVLFSDVLSSASVATPGGRPN